MVSDNGAVLFLTVVVRGDDDDGVEDDDEIRYSAGTLWMNGLMMIVKGSLYSG